MTFVLLKYWFAPRAVLKKKLPAPQYIRISPKSTKFTCTFLGKKKHEQGILSDGSDSGEYENGIAPKIELKHKSTRRDRSSLNEKVEGC